MILCRISVSDDIVLINLLGAVHNNFVILQIYWTFIIDNQGLKTNNYSVCDVQTTEQRAILT